LIIQITPFSRKWQILPGKYMQVLSSSHKMADYFAKLEKHKCLGNTIDGNIFNKHNDQEKKTLVKNSADNVSLHTKFTEWGEGEKKCFP
jgi:hypothetical protein